MNRGFTLIEMMIAMAIFTTIGLASTGLLTTVIDGSELSGDRLEKLQKLQRAVMIMERDIQQAIARPIRHEGDRTEIVMRGGSIDGSDADGMGFVRAGWANPQFMLPRGTLEFVGYKLEDNQLQRVSTVYVDNVIGHEPKIRVLLEDVDDFRVQFFAGQTANREISWSERYVGTVLPRGVAIEIETQTFGVIRREFELVDGEPANGG